MNVNVSHVNVINKFYRYEAPYIRFIMYDLDREHTRDTGQRFYFRGLEYIVTK